MSNEDEKSLGWGIRILYAKMPFNPHYIWYDTEMERDDEFEKFVYSDSKRIAKVDMQIFEKRGGG